ncbi:MAG: LysE family translocator [Chitinophagaceae bacterium]|nr:LysE family translocator [Chitinophagaceae bacterium]
MPFNEFLSYMTLVIVFALTPGPNMMLYLTYTFEYGRKAGWATAAGVVSSFVFHVSAVAFGLTALLLSHPQVFEIIRYCGIAYLFYLAYKNLKTIKWKEAGQRRTVVNLRRFYTDGFIGNLLNPGSLMLYFSILPQFVHPERGHVLRQNLMLGGLQMLGSFITNCTIVFFAGYAADTFFKNEKYQQWLRYCMSALIILFAVKMLFFKMK